MSPCRMSKTLSVRLELRYATRVKNRDGRSNSSRRSVGCRRWRLRDLRAVARKQRCSMCSPWRRHSAPRHSSYSQTLVFNPRRGHQGIPEGFWKLAGRNTLGPASTKAPHPGSGAGIVADVSRAPLGRIQFWRRTGGVTPGKFSSALRAGSQLRAMRRLENDAADAKRGTPTREGTAQAVARICRRNRGAMF